MILTRKTKLFYGIARFFGFFPYSWYFHRTDCKEGPITEKSSLWSVWSLLFTVFSIVIMVIDIYYSLTHPRGAEIGLLTVVVIHQIYDIVTAVSTALIQIIVLWRADLVTPIILGNYQMNPKGKTPVISLIIVYSVLVISPLKCYMYFKHLERHYDLVSLIPLFFKVVASIFVFLYIGIQYHDNLVLMAQRLRQIFSPFSDIYQLKKKELSKCSKVKMNQTDEAHQPTTGKRTILVEQISRILIDSKQIPDTETSHNPQLEKVDLDRPSRIPSDIKIDYDDIEEEILSVFEFHRVMNDYIALPMVICMFCLVTWLITAGFYSSLWPILSTEQKYFIALNIVATIVPILYFTNSTHYLTNEVSYCDIF